MSTFIKWVRFKIAWWSWFFEPPAVLDPNIRPFLPHGPERRRTLRALHERWQAREPKWPPDDDYEWDV